MSATDDTLSSYREKLLFSLRVRDVPGARIGDVLAEVESHVAETGEDPFEAFGPPREYAAQVAGVTGRVGRWRLTPGTAGVSLLIGLGAFAAGSWVLGGLLGLLADEADGALGLPPTMELFLGLVVGAAVIALLVRHTRREADPVLDPRTGREVDPIPASLPLALFVGVAVAVTALGLLVALL